MRILIIAHPAAGIRPEKRRTVELAASFFAKKGGSADITYIMKPGQGMNHASRAEIEGYDAVIAAGGDGTLNDVASGLVGRGTPLGIIPLGTGNGLARALGIPFDDNGMARMFDRWTIQPIDAGKIANRFFFSVAGIGYDAFIARAFNELEFPRRTVRSLWRIAIREYLIRRSETLTLTIDGTTIIRKTFGLTLCNSGHYGAGAVISPSSEPADGKFEAVLIPRLNPVSGLFAAKKVFAGAAENIGAIERIPFASLKIERSKPGFCQADGETFPVGKTITVTVLPGALQVIVP